MGWVTIDAGKGGLLRYRNLPFGAIVKIQRPPHPIQLKDLETKAKETRPLFIKLEPLDESQLPEMGKIGYRRDNWPLLASKTVVIDLTPDQEEITKRYSKDTRQSLRKAAEVIKVEATNCAPYSPILEEKLSQLYSLQQQSSKRHRFYLPPLRDLRREAKAFGQQAWVFLARNKEGVALAGAFISCSPDTAFYRHAAAGKEGLKTYAAYAVLNKVIQTMKKEGYQKLDLEGIFDERFPESTTRWKGFTVYKKKWGGEIVTYPGSFTKTFNPVLRLIFNQFARKRS